MASMRDIDIYVVRYEPDTFPRHRSIWLAFPEKGTHLLTTSPEPGDSIDYKVTSSFFFDDDGELESINCLPRTFDVNGKTCFIRIEMGQNCFSGDADDSFFDDPTFFVDYLHRIHLYEKGTAHRDPRAYTPCSVVETKEDISYIINFSSAPPKEDKEWVLDFSQEQ